MRTIICVLLHVLLAAGLLAEPFSIGLNYPWYQEGGEHHYGRLFGDLTDAQ